MSFGDLIILVAVAGVVAVLVFGKKKVVGWVKDKMTIWRR